MLEHSELLLSHLQEKTYRYVKDICAYVKGKFCVDHTVSGMTKWLQANGFRYKKPQGVPAKFDAAKQKEFIEFYEELKRDCGEREAIYFVDSVHPEHQTRLSYGWIFKGVRKMIGMTGKQYRMNVISGICLTNHRIVYEQSAKVNEDSIQSFLYRLRKKHPGDYKIHVIWDNAGYHRSKRV
ncbi:MAG: IS630 family transposase [Legionellales bacterium]|nr:IS630 family transposase [Legionellales bacterium]